MTDPNKTAIVVVLDRSGSMQLCRTDTIGGFNSFVQKQRELSVGGLDATLSLIQFDDQYEENYTYKDIHKVPALSDSSYVPRGHTALYDAIGKSIVSLGEKLSNLPESGRPGKVVFVIITDGQENASKEYKQKRIKELIEHQQEKYQWNFVYLGANQDAITTAARFGIAKGSAANYDVTNTHHAYASLSSNIGTMRASGAGGQSLHFSDEQRAALTQNPPK